MKKSKKNQQNQKNSKKWKNQKRKRKYKNKIKERKKGKRGLQGRGTSRDGSKNEFISSNVTRNRVAIEAKKQILSSKNELIKKNAKRTKNRKKRKKEKIKGKHKLKPWRLKVALRPPGVLIVFSPRLAQGNLLRENIQDFESLSETIHFTRVCEDASFWFPASAGMKYKTKPDEDDGFGQIIPFCREYPHSRVNPQSRAYAAIPEGTMTGPDIEVHIVKILDNFSTWDRNPSPNNPRRTL